MSLLAEARRKAEEQRAARESGDAAAGVRAAFRMAPPVRRVPRAWVMAVLGLALAGAGAGALWLLADGNGDAGAGDPISSAQDAESQTEGDEAAAEKEAEAGRPIILQSPEPPGSLVVRVFGADLPAPVIRREPQPSSSKAEDGDLDQSSQPQGPVMRALSDGEQPLVPGAGALQEDGLGSGVEPSEASVADASPESGTFRRERSDGDPKARARALVEHGDARRRAGDPRGAMDHYRRALELDADQRRARIGYAELLEQVGRSARAREVLGKGLAQDPEDAGMARRYAALADQAGDLEAAIEALESARDARAPGRAEAHLAALYRGTGQYERAAAVYEELIDAGENTSLWRAGLALSLEGLGDAERAIELWRAVANDPAADQPVVRHARQRLEALGADPQPEEGE